MKRSAKTRRAPEGGYSFEGKARFRSWVWGLIQTHTSLDTSPDVLLMPSLEALELDEALRRGFKQEQLHCVDDSPAVIAVLRRGTRFPLINGYGVPLDRAHLRIAEKGVRLRAASIDLCSNAGWETARMLGRCSDADCWGNGALIVINVLRGRETRETTRSIDITPIVRKSRWLTDVAKTTVDDGGPRLNLFDLWRVWLLGVALPRHIVLPVKTRTYVSANGQSFLTTALRVYRCEDVRRALVYREKWLRRAAEVFGRYVGMANVLTVLLEAGMHDECTFPADIVDRFSQRNSILETAERSLHPIVGEMISRFGQFGTAA